MPSSRFAPPEWLPAERMTSTRRRSSVPPASPTLAYRPTTHLVTISGINAGEPHWPPRNLLFLADGDTMAGRCFVSLFTLTCYHSESTGWLMRIPL